jgi:hypothetical protein
MPTTVDPNSTGDQLLALGALLGRSGRVIESEISGSSMGSTLPSRCRIRIHRLALEQYRPGQVIAFIAGGRMFAHRIVYRSRQGVLTRGDTHVWCDLPVPVCVILGVVAERFLDGKWCPLSEALPFDCQRSTQHRMIETLLRGCMQVDIRLADKVWRILMWFARRRRLLFEQICPPGDRTA